LQFVVIPTRRSTAETNIYDNQNITVKFRSLQYAMFFTMFVEVLGVLFYFLTTLHIQKDKALNNLTIACK